MKNPIPLFLAAAALLAYGDTARAFVYENAYECQGDGDFDGDGRPDLVIADKATGGYRIAYQLSAGNYTWVATRASGITPVTGIGIGKLFSISRDALAFTGPDANRVNLLDASASTVAGTPVSAYISSLGPNMVGVIDIGGAGNFPVDDLYIGSIYNDPGATPHETLLRNDGINQTSLADNALSPVGSFRERANQVLVKTNLAPRLGMYARKTGALNEEFRIYDLSSGAATLTLSVGGLNTPTPAEYVFAQFATNNPLPQYLFYHPSNTFFVRYQMVEAPPGTFSLPSGNVINLNSGIDRIFVLPATNGAKLCVFFGGGASAGVYYFDGVTTLTLVQSYQPDAGEHFTGIGVMGNKGFMAYSAPQGQNTSSKFKQWNWNGSSYTAGASGNLPTLSQFSASGNVIQFRNEPFVTNNPVMLRINNAGDWSSKPAIGASVSVFSENFAGATQGLVNPVPVSVGTKHPLANFGLANQYSNAISLYSFTPPQGDKVSEVTISPQAGSYPSAVTLTFTASDPTHLIFFRIAGGAWTSFTGQKIYLFTNATVQYYGQPLAGILKSTVRSAVYTFTTGPATLDSNKDGVPDYVAIAVGLDPNGARDTDGDGFSDLEELLHNTDPKNASSFPSTNAWPTNYWPANLLHIDDQSSFALSVTPWPWDGFSNRLSLCSTGVIIQVCNLQGATYGSSPTAFPSPPLAQITNISIDPLDRLIVMATPMHYSMLTTNTNSAIGREMLGLVPLPALTPFTVPYTNGGGNMFVEATNWIIAASNAWRSLTHPVIPATLTPYDTLEALLFEKHVATVLGARGDTNYTNITLFPYRTPDVGRTNPPQARLLSLETNLDAMHRGYQLAKLYTTISNSVENSLNAPIVNLRSVVLDIYRINSRYNNDYPATFASPVDEIRLFLWSGTLDSNYLAWSATSNLLASASNGVMSILANVLPRPTTNLTLQVRSDSFGLSCRILDQPGTNAPFVLQDSSALPFSFPDNFQLPPGSQVQVFGYTDVTNTVCAYPAIEVISIGLASIPLAADPDADGNLLIDSWEMKFFGHLGLDPYGDADGDGFTNLQEMMAGSDPSDPLNIPTNPAYSVSGQVEMEGFAGSAGTGAGSRMVTFKATDISGTVLAQWNLILNFTSGVASYACNGVPTNTVRFSAKTAWSLRKRLPVSFPTSSTIANFTSGSKLPAGDIDGSNRVDLEDYFQMASVWHIADSVSDINGSGLVYLDDYTLMAARWYQVGDPE